MAEGLTHAEKVAFLKQAYKDQVAICKRLKKHAARQSAPTLIVQQNADLIVILRGRLLKMGVLAAEVTALEKAQ